LEKDNFDTQANLISRESYRYDTNEKVLEKTITMNNQTAYKCVWQYDDKGKVVEKEEYFTELITPEKLDKLVIDDDQYSGGTLEKDKIFLR
jgi:putative YD repeat protein